MIFDGFVHQLPDTDPDETQEWLDSLDAVVDTHGKTRARFLLTKLLERARERRSASRPPCRTPYVNTIPREAGAVVPRRRAHRAPHPRLHPLERGGDGRQGQQARRRHRRPPVDLRQLGVAVRGRLQPLLPRQGRRHRRRPHLLPGPRRARHLRPRLPRGPPRPRTTSTTSAGRSAAAARPVELPAPAADARLLGVPDGVDGPRPDQRDLPGPVQPLPPQPPARRHQPSRGCGASSATASATSPRRSAPSRWPAGSSSTT